MTATTGRHPSLASAAPRARRPMGWLTATSLAVAASAMVAWALSGQRPSPRGIPPEQQRALLERTVSDLDRFCGPGRPAALQEHCRELAAFAASFDTCRGPCADLVRRELAPRPTR